MHEQRFIRDGLLAKIVISGAHSLSSLGLGWVSFRASHPSLHRNHSWSVVYVFFGLLFVFFVFFSGKKNISLSYRRHRSKFLPYTA